MRSWNQEGWHIKPPPPPPPSPSLDDEEEANEEEGEEGEVSLSRQMEAEPDHDVRGDSFREEESEVTPGTVAFVFRRVTERF